MTHDTLSFKQAVKYLMKSQRVSRATAENFIKTAVAKGNLPAHIPHPYSGKPIPYRTQHYLTETQNPPNQLHPHHAAHLARTNPDDVLIPFHELILKFGFSEPELQNELKAGRLTAHGELNLTGQPSNLHLTARFLAVSVLNLTQWLANPNAPPILQSRIRQNLTTLAAKPN